MNNHPIENDHQYNVTKYWVDNFEEGLRQVKIYEEQIPEGDENLRILNKMLITSYESTIQEMKEKLSEYEQSKIQQTAETVSKNTGTDKG